MTDIRIVDVAGLHLIDNKPMVVFKCNKGTIIFPVDEKATNRLVG
jgi:hypothetical protein